MRVEEVRGPVQADGRLAGARGALHTDRGREITPYQLVLFGLDGGGDVPHGADTGALDLPGNDAAAAEHALVGAAPRVGRPPCSDGLVLQAGEVGGVAAAARGPAEAAADGDALWLAGARLVEGP